MKDALQCVSTEKPLYLCYYEPLNLKKIDQNPTSLRHPQPHR